MSTALSVEALRPEHWDRVADIYAAGIATGNATFETTVPDWVTWDGAHLPEHRFVALDEEHTVIGWIAASSVSSRCVYAGVIEHSVYVDPAWHSRRVAHRLLEALIASSEAAGIWTIQTGIFPENLASLAVHHRCGFRTLGRRERIGKHHDRWRDVLLLERRSPTMA